MSPSTGLVKESMKQSRGNAGYWRARAQDLRTIALSMTSTHSRDRLLRIAMEHDAMAIQIEADEKAARPS